MEYYTTPRANSEVHIERQFESRRLGSTACALGEVTVKHQVIGYRRQRLLRSDEPERLSLVRDFFAEIDLGGFIKLVNRIGQNVQRLEQVRRVVDDDVREAEASYGIARRGGVWCRRCEYAGEITAPVRIRIQIPPAARHGAITVGISEAGGRPPPVRLTIAA